MGLDTALNNRLRESTGRHKIRFDPFEDLEHFAATLLRQKKLGIFTIGGGVPRNWSQQFGPFMRIAAPAPRRERAVEALPLRSQNLPEPVYWGGLSGSPYSEAISWGKFVPPSEGGKFGEVFVDATVGLPIIVAAVIERLDKAKKGRPQGRPGRVQEVKLTREFCTAEGNGVRLVRAELQLKPRITRCSRRQTNPER